MRSGCKWVKVILKISPLFSLGLRRRGRRTWTANRSICVLWVQMGESNPKDFSSIFFRAPEKGKKDLDSQQVHMCALGANELK